MGERLRAEQQKLNRSGQVADIQYYKEQYKARMKKIIEIAELPFSEAETARRLGNWHIAKPLTNQEMSRVDRLNAQPARDAPVVQICFRINSPTQLTTISSSLTSDNRT